MTLRTRLGLALATLAMPLAALAVPANVTGITAVLEGGKVRATWEQAGTVASYRIFYSHQSILENNGSYDDFVNVDGSVNSHLLQSIPPSPELYVSVLAVDSTGAESPFFVEEARVTLDGTTQPSSAGAQASSAAQTNNSSTELRLLSTEVLSATGLTLRFSHRVTIPTDQAQDAIIIENSSGARLQLTRFVLQDTSVTIHTTVQERGMVYRVRVTPTVTGVAADGTAVNLASDQTPMLFVGHITGSAPAAVNPSSAPSQQQSSQPTHTTAGTDVQNLRLRAEPDGTTYAVTASWQVPQDTMVVGFDISQSTDGRTFGESHMVSKDTASIRIPSVPSGVFALRIRVIRSDQTVSAGVSQSIQLPANQSPVGGNVTGGSTTLPNSGPALWLAVMAAGGTVGAWRVRRNKNAVA